jgi:ribosomal protein S17
MTFVLGDHMVGRYEAVYHQAVADAEARHQQVDAQNDQLRVMIGDLQKKVQHLESKGESNTVGFDVVSMCSQWDGVLPIGCPPL